jgi:hypothetical protein
MLTGELIVPVALVLTAAMSFGARNGPTVHRPLRTAGGVLKRSLYDEAIRADGRGEEEDMHPMIVQAHSAERDREWREQAAVWRRVREARRSPRPLTRITRTRLPLRAPAAG